MVPLTRISCERFTALDNDSVDPWHDVPVWDRGSPVVLGTPADTLFEGSGATRIKGSATPTYSR